MFDKETILIIALAGLIIYILMSNKDEYTACVQNSKPKATFSVPSQFGDCNPIAGGCNNHIATRFQDSSIPLTGTETPKMETNPFASPVNQTNDFAVSKNHIITPEFGYPLSFATKGAKMAMN